MEKFLVWFQAEHTIPNPLFLNNPQADSDGASLVRMADLFGWPSDFRTWKRVLIWLLSIAPSLPARLVPNVLELFKVWQNAFGDIRNDVSERIISVCSEWLMDLESVSYRDKFSMDYGRWQDLGNKTVLEEGLRFTILRSGRSFPDAAIGIVDRALKNERMRRRIYDELIGFSPILSCVAPEKLASLARAELMDTLPKAEIDEERQSSKRYYAMLKRIRDKPEHERSEHEQKILSTPTFIGGNKRYNLDDVAIDSHHQSFFPPSPLHEPFGSLFKASPDLARTLVRDLANHAMEAWRQLHDIDRARHGTPIPMDLDFPWGRQRLWGDWRIYNWFEGQLAPQPLECAFLALSYWAHKRLDDGIPLDDIIKDVVEGHECWAVLGMAASLALEQMCASETVLPLATNQRLWHVDLARMVQERASDVDLLGLGLNKRLSTDRAAALDYLKARKSRFREIRNLVPVFALNGDENLRDRFRSALAAFPNELPYMYEEERSSAGRTQSLLESARIWAGWGDAENYKMRDVAGQPGTKLVEYQAPAPLPDAIRGRLGKTALSLRDSGILAWAKGSLEAGALKQGVALGDALAHVRARETPDIFAAAADPGRERSRAVRAPLRQRRLLEEDRRGISEPAHRHRHGAVHSAFDHRPGRPRPGGHRSTGPAPHRVDARLRRAQGVHPGAEVRLHRRAHGGDDVLGEAPRGDSVQRAAEHAGALILLRADGPHRSRFPQRAQPPEDQRHPHPAEVDRRSPSRLNRRVITMPVRYERDDARRRVVVTVQGAFQTRDHGPGGITSSD